MNPVERPVKVIERHMNGRIRNGSAAFGHCSPVLRENCHMLARRFTVVCLLIALFGMGLSVLVAEKSRFSPPRTGQFAACDLSNPVGCSLRIGG